MSDPFSEVARSIQNVESKAIQMGIAIGKREQAAAVAELVAVLQAAENCLRKCRYIGAERDDISAILAKHSAPVDLAAEDAARMNAGFGAALAITDGIVNGDEK